MKVTNYNKSNREDLEKYILGCILITENNHQGKHNLKNLMFSHGYYDTDCFSSDFHKDLYDCILTCWENDIVADIVTVTAIKPVKYKSLTTSEVNFDLTIISYTNLISSSAHLEWHLFILKQYIWMDFWNKLANDIEGNYWENRDVVIFNQNFLDRFNNLDKRLTGGLNSSSGPQTLGDKIKEDYEKMKAGGQIGLPWGIIEIDLWNNGFQPGEFHVAAGRPGMGKTTVILAACYYSAKKFQKKGIFFSLEMTELQITAKIACSELGLDFQDYRTGRLTAVEIINLSNFVNDFKRTSSLEIVDNCRTIGSIVRYVQEKNPEFIVIDYIQIVKLSDESYSSKKIGNREQEVAFVSNELNTISKTMNIPVIGLSQLSRGVDSRPNKRPVLADLRESGSLEQDADNVIFFYRDNYYRKQQNEYVPEIEEGNLEINYAKGRNSGTKNFKAHINFATFELSDGFRYQSDVGPPRPP
jgi:replicative DNA helicase